MGERPELVIFMINNRTIIIKSRQISSPWIGREGVVGRGVCLTCLK